MKFWCFHLQKITFILVSILLQRSGKGPSNWRHKKPLTPRIYSQLAKWSNVKQSTWGCYCVNHKLSSERNFFIFERKTPHAEPPHKGLYLCTRTNHNHARPQTNSSAKMLACEQALLFGQASLARTPLVRTPLVRTPPLRRSLARSRETRFTRPNRRACSQATKMPMIGSLNFCVLSLKKLKIN